MVFYAAENFIKRSNEIFKDSPKDQHLKSVIWMFSKLKQEHPFVYKELLTSFRISEEQNEYIV